MTFTDFEGHPWSPRARFEGDLYGPGRDGDGVYDEEGGKRGIAFYTRGL
jgi:hypothetical protein